MEKRRTTVKDIAARMNISLSTVNKALTGKPGISETRRAEVIAVAKEMGYVVNHVAQSLSRKPIKMGVIIPEVNEEYFGLIQRGIQLEFEKLLQQNVEGVFQHVRNEADIRNAAQTYIEQKIDILIYCPSLIKVPKDVGAALADKKIPVFILGEECSEIESVCSVVINAELSGQMAADFLKLLLQDNSEVAVFTGSKEMHTHALKAENFTTRAKMVGLNPVGVYETRDNRQAVETCVREMLAAYPGVGGIYAATAIAPMITEQFKDMPAEQRPYIVATDIYEDIRREMADGRIAATIYQNQVLMGRLAVKMAYRYIVGIASYQAIEEKFSEHIRVSPHLFLRSNMQALIPEDGNDYVLE